MYASHTVCCLFLPPKLELAHKVLMKQQASLKDSPLPMPSRFHFICIAPLTIATKQLYRIAHTLS